MIGVHICLSHTYTLHLSSNQLFKLCLVFISSPTFLTHFFILGETEGKRLEDHPYCQQSGLKAALFSDAECTYNILWRIHVHVEELHEAAKESLKAIEVLEDPFDSLFGYKHFPELLWDAIFTLPHCPPAESQTSNNRVDFASLQ
ncbi:hypothetical protein IE077_001447 [Cardiosporidium cionae]|uniref:Nrap protein domain-containing protein n=1 Tax=Cardiosporidium cionae TaxID=476202 RepID=A0ABQ7JCV4_9APIC|nr:hypothetical protein IE077_001447 [Cardiosporidium cionae]|eukprot:KAF8821871.1 hypothetical protein IE077_001447 [Cardiosporidium cionae]